MTNETAKMQAEAIIRKLLPVAKEKGNKSEFVMAIKIAAVVTWFFIGNACMI